MAVFPELTPSSRTYTPGEHPNTPLMVLTGDESSVRHSNGAVGHRLRMTFKLLTQAENYSIIGHYSLHGRFVPFDLSATTLSAAGLTFPTNYQWIYAGTPETDEECGEITTTVELELIPPYTI